MSPRTNRQWILKARPEGMVQPSIFEQRESPVPEPTSGQILAKTMLLSFEPAQRTWMSRETYLPIVPLGEPMRSYGIAQVIASKHPKFKPGDIVSGYVGWQEYVILEPNQPDPPFKLPGHLNPTLTLALAVTGVTAYFGLLDIGKPKAGETVVVSGAAGATGSIAGQIAKLKGCRVIGIAGGADKCQWLLEKAHFDGAIDYKNQNVREQLSQLCPDGVNVYFDNVGGPILDEVLLHLALHARVVLCGAISQYNLEADEVYGVQNFFNLILKRGTAQGFIVTDHVDRALEAVLCLHRWTAEGKLVQEIDVQHGFDAIPATLLRLFSGSKLGKQLLKVAEAPLPVRTSATERRVFNLLSAVTGWRKG